MSEAGAPSAESAGAGPRRWVIWGLGATAFGFAFFMRVSPSVMVDDLMRDFSVGAAVLGNLSAIYLYVYAGLQIPIGALMDRWGPRIMISSSIALAGAGTAMFAAAHTVEIAYAGRFLIGVGSGCAFVGSLTLAGRWFAPGRFAFMSGLTMFMGMIGGILGQAPLARALTLFDWREALYGAAAFALLLALAIWIVVRDAPQHPRSAVQNISGRDLARNMLVAFRSPMVWMIALAGASFTGPLLAFGGLWGVPYLTLKFGLEAEEAALWATFNLIGFAAGAPFAGWLSDRIGRRKLPLIIACIINIASLSLMFYANVGLTLSILLIFVIGLMSGGMIVCYALAREVTRPHIHGAVIGLINTGAVGAGAVLQPVIGGLLDRQWDGTVADGVRVYSIDAYNIAFSSLLVWAVMGLICLMFVRETYCRQLPETMSA